ncbi:SGNH/GDSL hydrolase family protein [Actinomycetospora endophytica]|uniref:SGNH/GDSL hydrolase family protein n=1 Tax=Actinomycetospora endophytica TaxID=2291215 RepID=A0ABS8PEJ0_9PSEU|nr:SGNH/GDSL hydrolase family protein [Actinomycetospora endophytica]MCD2196653.1 SGNH/GDSL hydrolase family protein [Actinomycetospora endophytica]
MRIVTVAAAAVLAVLAGLLVVRVNADVRAAAEVHPAPVAATAAVGTRPMLGVIGDSFAAGTVIGGAGGTGFPMMIADRVGWRWGTTAVGGTGYVAHPAGTLPYEAEQVERMVAAQPAVLVVEGSQNDGSAAPAAVGTAADAMFARLERELPRTRIVVVGPVASNSRQAAALAGVDAAVGSSARRAGLPYVDALAEGWFTDAQAALIGSDHIHPTTAGHARIADLLGADLARLGVLPPART